MVGHPRVVSFDRTAEGRDEGRESAREIAEADEADAGAVKREAALCALEQPFLFALPHRAVGCGHATAKVDGHSERISATGLAKATLRKHMDFAFEAVVVVDVLEEIGLDIDDGASFGARSRRVRHVALADQKAMSGR